MNRFFLLSLSVIIYTWLALTGTSCSSGGRNHYEPNRPTPAPKPEPEPDPDPEDESLARLYFDASLAGKNLPDLGEADIINPDDYDAVKDELWSKWKAANEAFSEGTLPSLIDMSKDVNYANPTATGSWPIAGVSMLFLYGHKGKKPADGYPLFIFLHGSGSDSQEEWAVCSGWCEYFNDAPSAYFIPRSPSGGTGCRWYQPSRQEAWERVIRRAYLSGNIDPNKIYFVGISEGGYGSQRLASYYADYLAGAGPIAGGEPFYNCPPENTANIAYCQQTGENDTMYGRSRIVQKAIEEWDRLSAAHPGYYVHKINLQPNLSHECDYTVTTPWLKKYSRNPWPKYVFWENYGMGNTNGESYNCRSGFYNLRVLEGQNGKTDGPNRDSYEMTIDGNNIDLKVNSVFVQPSEPVSENGWTINIGVSKTSTPATKGKVRIYLNKELVDITKPVSVTVNGEKKFEGDVVFDRRNMIESLAFFFDPCRIFPAAVDVTVE